MSMNDEDSEVGRCQICDRIAYPLNECEDSGYSRICLTCVAEMAMECRDCAETLANLDAETRALYANL